MTFGELYSFITWSSCGRHSLVWLAPQHTLIPMNTLTQTLPYEHLRTEPTIRQIHHRCLTVDENVVYHWKHNAVNSEKFIVMESWTLRNSLPHRVELRTWCATDAFVKTRLHALSNYVALVSPSQCDTDLWYVFSFDVIYPSCILLLGMSMLKLNRENTV
jgi:hypothetical protein